MTDAMTDIERAKQRVRITSGGDIANTQVYVDGKHLWSGRPCRASPSPLL
jgi:hypothetical protein